MITVRFDTGFSVQYNDLNWAKTTSEGIFLYRNSKSTGWSARAPHSAIVEIIQPCRTYNPTLFSRDPRMEAVEKELRGLKNRIPDRAKKAKNAK